MQSVGILSSMTNHLDENWYQKLCDITALVSETVNPLEPIVSFAEEPLGSFASCTLSNTR